MINRQTAHTATKCQTLSTTMRLHGANGGFTNSACRFIFVIQKLMMGVRSWMK